MPRTFPCTLAPMFYLFVVLAMLGYSLQANLLVRHARALSGFQVALYRGISLCFLMLPMLLFAKKEDFVAIFQPEPMLLLFLAGFAGFGANSTSLQAVRHLPVGISETINTAGKALLFIFAGMLLYNETLSLVEGGLIAVIVLSAILLARQKHTVNSVEVNLPKGLALLAFSIVMAVTCISLMSYVSKTVDPYVTAYFWEAIIGLVGIFLFRVSHKSFPRVSWKQFWKIFWATSPTLLGSGFFVYALSIGPLSIAGAIMTGGIFISTLLAWLLYGEKLTWRHWALMICIAVSIAGLKLVGG